MSSEAVLAQIREKINLVQRSKAEKTDGTSKESVSVVTPEVVLEEDVKDERQLEVQLLMDKIKPSACGKKRNYSQIDISADKWFLTLDPQAFQKLSEPPSLADGLDLKEEKELRLLGCEMIQNGAILLRLPQTAAATGQILFQRYYYQKSFVRYNFLHTVMACLLLASRIEEATRRPRDVINVVNRLKQLMQNKDRSKFVHLTLDKNYSELKNLVIKTERRLLNILGFVVHVHHPHKLIISYAHVLLIANERKDILVKAWNYMNDGLRTDIFLRYNAETIACACLFLAARTVENPIVLPTEPQPWYELYDCTTEDMHTISMILINLYNNQKIPSLSRLHAHVEKLYKEKYGKPEPPPVETKKEDGKEKKSQSDRDGESKRSKTPKKDRERGDRDRRDRRRERSKSRSPRRDTRSDRDTRTKREKERDRDRDRDRRDRKRTRSRSPARPSQDRRRERDYDRDRSSHRRRN